jgi:small subunit ribosomal protein S3
MKERIFIKKSKEQISLREFVKKQFREAKCGFIDVQHTPVATRIIIHTTTPGIIIGSGGENIKDAIEIIKRDFKIDNPQIDVQKIDVPDLDADIVAQTIAASIESGVNYKRLGNFYVSKIMNAGAIGCEIVIAGKLGGEKSRTERFTEGYLKKCGDPAEKDVMKGWALANPKLGNIGILVKIMMYQPETLRHMVTKEEVKEEKKVVKEAVKEVKAEKTEETNAE